MPGQKLISTLLLTFAYNPLPLSLTNQSIGAWGDTTGSFTWRSGLAPCFIAQPIPQPSLPIQRITGIPQHLNPLWMEWGDPCFRIRSNF